MSRNCIHHKQTQQQTQSTKQVNKQTEETDTTKIQPICSKCKSTSYIKFGFYNNKQRYKCKNCNCQYAMDNKKEYPEFMKLRVIELLLSKMSIRGMARELNVSPQTVSNWINKFEKDHKIDKDNNDINISNVKSVEIDEMWHYYKSKKK